MATWNEIDNFLQGHGFKKDGEFWMGGYNLPDGRSQMALIGRYDFEGDNLDHIRVMSPFAKTSDISAEQALSQAKLFGVCSTGTYYCLTDSIPIAEADANDVLVPLQLLSLLADQAEQAFGTHDSL